MKELQLGEAKSTLSAIIEAAEKGEPTTITKHGRRAAVIISYEEWSKLKRKVPSFADSFWQCPNLPWRTCPRGVPPGSCVGVFPIDVRFFRTDSVQFDRQTIIRSFPRKRESNLLGPGSPFAGMSG
jgi:antitoxin Phd